MKFSTKAIHVGNEPNFAKGGSGDVVVPINLSTTFARKKLNSPASSYDYSRSGNPTRAALEKNLASLEDGLYAYAFSSGMAAVANVLLLLNPGDHVISIDNVYGGTFRLLTKVFAEKGIEITFNDFSSADEVKKHVRKNTKMLLLESPSNPSLKIIDLKSISKFAKQKNIITVIDNTFATPYFQKPLNLGIDIVVHSLTKYIGGHSDVVGGCVITKDKELAGKIKFLQNSIGAILSPFDSYQVLKGIKTLALRMEKHEENAKEITHFLANHKKIRTVYYPGLPTHPGHRIAKKQMTGFGGIISFELIGSYNEAVKFLESLSLISLAVSLGAVESLIEHPASMTHATFSPEDLKKAGISDTLIRISVGIEDSEDIIQDLKQALTKIQ